MINKYIFIFALILLQSVNGKADVSRRSWYNQLVNAKFTMLNDLNLPVGEQKYIVSIEPGKIHSPDELQLSLYYYLSKAKKDEYIKLIEFYTKTDEKKYGYTDTLKDTSQDILIEKNFIGEFTSFQGDCLKSLSLGPDPLVPDRTISLYLCVYTFKVVEIKEKGVKSSMKLKRIGEGKETASIGVVQDLLSGLISFDLSSIPIHRVGPK